MNTNGHHTQFLIFQDKFDSPRALKGPLGADNDAWRIASTDGRLSTFSALYPCLDTAVALLEEAGVSYRVVRFEDVPPEERVEGWVIEAEWPVEAIEDEAVMA